MDTTTSPSPSSPSAAPPAALWEDFVDVFYAPREVFARREARRWPLVLLGLTAAALLLFLASQGVLAPVMDLEIDRALRANPNVNPEQMERAREMSRVLGGIGFAVTFPLGMIAVGVALWAVGKLFDSTATLSAAILVAVFAQFPRLLQQLVVVAQALVMDTGAMRSMYALSLSPARFLDPDAASPVLLGLAGRVDPFVLWSTVLLAIGLQVRGGVPRGASYLAAGLVWLLGALPTILPALAAG